jgi:hypothetical protein
MPTYFYLMPIARVDNGRGPKYLKWRFNPTGIDCQWSMKDYGSIDYGCLAVNATVEQHTTLVGYTDNYQFPENLDAIMTSAQRSTLEAFLEAVAVPGDWITAQDSFRTALRTVTGMFMFMQRLTALAGSNPLNWGITLNTQWRNLSAQQQSWITDAFMSLGYSAAFITNNTQVRRIIKAASEQWGARPIYFGFVEL